MQQIDNTKKTRIINNNLEIILVKTSVVVTLALFALLFGSLANYAYNYYNQNKLVLVAETIVFAICMFFMCYGNLLYQICLIGYYKRKKSHIKASRQEIDRLYIGKSPSLSILVPSYKEEHDVIWQTLVSAALAEYKHKNIVLLIDDPYCPKSLEDILKLEATRNIIAEIQATFDEPHSRFKSELEAFLLRKNQNELHYDVELNRISILYDEVAVWLESLAGKFSGKFFVEEIILAPANSHRLTASQIRSLIGSEAPENLEYLEIQYSRIASLFNVSFSSFERKKYKNLSHEANKAMNLNSYIALIGKSWKEVEVSGGLELHETTEEDADFTIPASDYIDTLDADTVMLSEYAIRLIHIMEQKGNEKIAVIQSPCSTLPGASNELERVAGACIDVQFQTHQGYTDWGSTFWVGANAMLRYKALEEIKEIHDENGKKVAVYIQDRTVIEDTESTIDLVEKGWKLYNYPERMTFSPTPPDFGSLLIQRRRWSNGGMIILPKLLSYTKKSKFSLALLKEFFMRFHYLSSTTTVCISAAIMFVYPFGEISGSIWLSLSVLPCLLIYARDLKNCGYKYSDSIRICALTIMLFPIMIGGVLKQFQQMITGKKIPFGRTPKITGRTAAPAIYCFIELALLSYCTGNAFNHLYNNEIGLSICAILNSSFMIYALVKFMGVKATLEDMFAVLISSWKRMSHNVEIIPFSAIRRTRNYLVPLRRRLEPLRDNYNILISDSN
ncbi:MAG: glycosyltransferase family 2 protein [Pseudomonadota bacterium]